MTGILIFVGLGLLMLIAVKVFMQDVFKIFPNSFGGSESFIGGILIFLLILGMIVNFTTNIFPYIQDVPAIFFIGPLILIWIVYMIWTKISDQNK